MTTISPSPSISPKPFSSGSSSSNPVVPSSRSAWGAASSRSAGGTSPFLRSRPSPTISGPAAAGGGVASSKPRDVVPAGRSAGNSISSASVVSPGSGGGLRSSPRVSESQQQQQQQQQQQHPQIDSVSTSVIRTTSLRPAPVTAVPSRDFGTQYSPPGFPPTAGAIYPKGPPYDLPLSSATTKLGQDKAFAVTIGVDRGRDVVMSDRPTALESSTGSGSQTRSTPHVAAAPAATVATVATATAAGKETTQSTTSTTTAIHSSDISAQAAATRSMRTPKRPDSNASDSTSGSSALSLVNSLPSPSKKSRLNAPNMKVMPRNYMECDIRELGIIIADMLGELIRLNDKLPPRDGFLTRFHSRAPPTISVRDYLHRLIVHATLSPPLLLALVYYIDRLCALYPAFTITSLTVHRFLITAATVAAKGLSDSFWTNHTYARVGGVSTKELAMLELDFLSRLDWAIVPKPEVLEDYYRSLIARTEGYVLEEGGSSDES